MYATGAVGGRVVIWDAAARRPLAAFDAGGAVRSVAFAPNLAPKFTSIPNSAHPTSHPNLQPKSQSLKPIWVTLHLAPSYLNDKL